MMNAYLSGVLAKFDHQLAFMLASFMAVNVLLTAVKKGLARIKDKTASKLDDRAFEVVTKVLDYSDKALEFLTANSTALPPEAKIELESSPSPSSGSDPAKKG